ncbi:TPA: ead/Ea22-like family protein [Citrobacter koseri]
MSNVDKQALRDIAESIEREEWELLDNGDDEYQVIVKGSLEKGETFRSYQPVSNEISERKIAAFIAAFGPATALALLDELEAAEKRNAELVHNHRVHAARLIDERGQLKQRIAELEAREVKLPELKMLRDYLAEVTMREREDILVGIRLEFFRALEEAGVKVAAAAGKGE